MSKLINWSEVSRLLTNDRTAIRSDYSGKKYKEQVDQLKRLVKEWKALQKQPDMEDMTDKFDEEKSLERSNRMSKAIQDYPL